MNSFVAPNSPAPAPEEDAEITNHSFFPALSLSAFRESMRVDTVTTPDRALHALRAAMLEVNTRLADWMDTQTAAGIESLDDVPLKRGHPPESNKEFYLRAVWSLAKAQLVERYRDYDSTKSGHDNADELGPTADDYRRDAAWSINDLADVPRSTVELI